MAGAASRRPQLSHGLWTGLWAALVAVVAIVVVQTLTADETPAGYRILFRLVGTAYVACGLIAWRRRPDSRSGLLMTATGFLLFLEPLLDGFGSLGDLTEDLWSITIIWLLLTMLSGGRLTSRVDKTLVGLFVLEFAIEAVRLATGGAEDGALAGVEGLVVVHRLPRHRGRDRSALRPRQRAAAARPVAERRGHRRAAPVRGRPGRRAADLVPLGRGALAARRPGGLPRRVAALATGPRWTG